MPVYIFVLKMASCRVELAHLERPTIVTMFGLPAANYTIMMIVEHGLLTVL